MSEATISVVSPKSLVAIFGTCDQHLRKLREALGVSITARDGQIYVRGEEEAVARATRILEQLHDRARRFGHVAEEEVDRLLRDADRGWPLSEVGVIEVYHGRQVRPRTEGQARYVAAMERAEVVMCIGPAGTGKTYLAVAVAASWLKAGRVRKIVLVRPAVEAGESLGYLPGDLQAKINPYLRPLMDALREMMEPELIRKYSEEDVIEVIPLAYMRGRTLNQACMILDEAQNTTVAQMKMFLTRMGHGSKIIVSGDVTQVDLPPHTKSGLVDALSRLRGIDGVVAVELTQRDIVRHRLVQDIVNAYEQPRKRRR